MIIGVDIDDVIFESSESFATILEKCNDEEILNHKLDLMRGKSDNIKVKEFLKENVISVIKNAKPKENARSIIKLLRDNSNKIVLITARGDIRFPGSQEITENALKKYQIEYDDIIYNSDDKAKDCKENNIELFIDDSPQNCIEVKNNLNIPTIGFKSIVTCNEFDKTNLICVSSWNELYEKLKSIIN